jgi:hypothetical protein
MSGGVYDYVYIRLKDLADQIRYENDHPAIRRRISEYLSYLSKIMYEVEWYDSGDRGKEAWIEIRRLLGKFGQTALDDVKLDKAAKFDMIKEIVEGA